MGKILFILMPKNYRDEEFREPYNSLINKKYIVDVAGFNDQIAKGANGDSFTPNKNLNNLTEKDFDSYDALVIPGGPGSEQYLWNNKKIQDTIKYFNNNKKIVAAICYAIVTPVQAGILNNKLVSASKAPEILNFLKENNAILNSQDITILNQDKIITAKGPAQAKDFSNAIIKLLEESK